MNCAWGIEKIGYVLICYAIVDAIGSICCAPIIKHTGRMVILIFAAVLHISAIIAMLTWRPNPENPIMFFIVAGVWGLADAVWQTQIGGR